jgi:hypothetical protein
MKKNTWTITYKAVGKDTIEFEYPVTAEEAKTLFLRGETYLGYYGDGPFEFIDSDYSFPDEASIIGVE